MKKTTKTLISLFVFSLSCLSALSPILASCPVGQLETPGGCIPYPQQTGGKFSFSNLSIGSLISQAIPYLFIFAGLTMLAFLIFGGFQLMTSGGDPKAIQSGQGKITNALIGFGVIFASYWVIQILQVVFHVAIVSAI